MNRTKIIGTIGPASRDRQTLARLMKAGMNVCRLNFSHGTRDEHAALIRDIRRVAQEEGRHVAILQDLAGPKIRTGPLASGTVTLAEGASFRLTNREVPGDETEVGLTYPDLPGIVRAGDTLMLADGLMELTVESADGTDVECRVVKGGPLGSHKGINLPGRTIDAAILSPKDRADLEFGLAQEVDYIALSFVRGAEDVAAANEIIAAAGKDTPVIAKIEKFEALDNIDGIIAAAGGIMVARGDLGVEIPLEKVPRAQKTIIRRSNAAGKPVITATQMLRSMVDNPRPTRAEVTDVANAILDGTDAIMLSEETAVGQFPVQAVEVMTRVAAETEKAFDFEGWTKKFKLDRTMSFEAAVALSAVEMAHDIGATAIITCTKSGSTTRLVARHRPRQPLLALTPEHKTAQEMALVFGAEPLISAPVESGDLLEKQAIKAAYRAGYVKKGDAVVITAGLPFHVEGTTNLIKIARVGRKDGTL
ncbi:MAG: pyruvate kinase [Candidatus Krumholzibacteriota bacterium]